MRRLAVALSLSLLWASLAFAQSGYSVITKAGAGNSSILNLTVPQASITPQNNPLIGDSPTAFSLGIVCTMSGGASLTYTLQVTADPQPSAGGNWNPHDILVNLTASTNSNIAFPVTGLRLSVTNYVSGSVTCGVAKFP